MRPAIALYRMSDPLSFNVSGDLTVGGDVSGSSSKSNVDDTSAKYVEKELDEVRWQLGKIQSDIVSVKTELAAWRERLQHLEKIQSDIVSVKTDLAAWRERFNFIIFGTLSFSLLVGAIVLIVNSYAH